MKRESKKNFSPAALAGFFQAQAGLAITEDLDVWPRLLSQLQPERVTAGILTWGYERWMEETMEPNQVWVWITCYVDHEQEAADALRKAFAAAGIPEQLLDIVVPTRFNEVTRKVGAAEGEMTGLEQVRNLRFSGNIMAKVLQTEAAAAALRNGSGDEPVTGWVFQRAARRAQDKPQKTEPGELSFRPGDHVRVRVWPFEGFSGRVKVVEKKKGQILVGIPGQWPGGIYLKPGEVARKAEGEDEDDPSRAWYVLYGYPGKEEKLRDNLRQRLHEAGQMGRLFDILIPGLGQDRITLVEAGKVHTIDPSLFPGAVFVLIALDEATWNIVRQTPGLTGFVGSGTQPRAYPPAKPPNVIGQNNERMEGKPPAQKGDRVRILSGPFYDFRGVVVDVDEQRATVRVMIDFFGRPTPVEVTYEQVEKE